MAPSLDSGYVLKENIFDFGGLYYVPYTAINKNTIIDTFTNNELCNLLQPIQDGYAEYTYTGMGITINSVNKNTIVSDKTTYTRVVPLQTSITLTRNASKDVIGHPNLIDANTLYNVTDDTDTGIDLLKTIYPVGSVYETSNPTCPLANLFGTWVQEPNIVNDKFIIETYINGTNGYIIWNNGYCEQWGNSVTPTTINFSKTWANTNYIIVGSEAGGDDNARAIKFNRNNRTVNSIRVIGSANPIQVDWNARGYLASDQYTHINIPTYNKFRRIA